MPPSRCWGTVLAQGSHLPWFQGRGSTGGSPRPRQAPLSSSTRAAAGAEPRPPLPGKRSGAGAVPKATAGSVSPVFAVRDVGPGADGLCPSSTEHLPPTCQVLLPGLAPAHLLAPGRLDCTSLCRMVQPCSSEEEEPAGTLSALVLVGHHKHRSLWDACSWHWGVPSSSHCSWHTGKVRLTWMCRHKPLSGLCVMVWAQPE